MADHNYCLCTLTFIEQVAFQQVLFHFQNHAGSVLQVLRLRNTSSLASEVR
jgi:hypothetical protein